MVSIAFPPDRPDLAVWANTIETGQRLSWVAAVAGTDAAATVIVLLLR